MNSHLLVAFTLTSHVPALGLVRTYSLLSTTHTHTHTPHPPYNYHIGLTLPPQLNMATTRARFIPHDPTTWTSEGMRRHLLSGKMGDTFYKLLFHWDDANLQEAFQRANAALLRAGISLDENLCRIRLVKGSDQWTEGAYKRLVAEADLVSGESNADLMFCLPHERSKTHPPNWFRKNMMYTGRQPKTQYAFPTITQKFFQHARDTAKSDAKNRADSHAHDAMDTEAPGPDTPISPDSVSKSDTSPTRSIGRPQLHEADVHVGWVVQQNDGSFVLEKEFRSLRTWLDGPTRWHYNSEKIRKSLRMTEDPELQLFWFEDLAGQPWSVKDHHAIAGAIERMHRKGEICFLLAKSIEFVRALMPAQRGQYNLLWRIQVTAANSLTDIAKQTLQVVTLNLSASGTFFQQSHSSKAPGHNIRRANMTPYTIPGISVSLARILGEQAMRSRAEYEKR
jgi:hypothetical protein